MEQPDTVPRVETPPRAARVEVEDAERMNLLGLLLRSLLDRRLETPRGTRHARRLTGDVRIGAGAMRVTLCFGAGSVLITRREPRAPIATVEGTLSALLDAALGRRRLRHLLRGELRARGAPDALLHLLALLRV